jgi:hypothetical protein
LPSKKVSPATLQERVLTLMDQHVAILEEEMTAYVDYKEREKAGTLDDEEREPDISRYLSMNLTSYLRSLSDYQESQDEGIGKQLKALQKMSHDQILKIKADFDKRNK